MESNRPNLFIVGAPRCGTTSLHSLLAQHPDIYMSPVKEPHFFARDVNQRYEEHLGRRIPSLYKDLDRYLRLFDNAGGRKIRGESSVYYLYSRVAAEEIKRFDPAAKIVILLREPVDFLHSLYGRLRSMGDETAKTFEEALELEDARRRGERLPGTVRFPELLFYSRYAQFAEQIELYRRVFSPDQVLVLLLEEYRAERERTYSRVLDFLEVAPLPPSGQEQKNPHQEPRSLRLTVFLRERVHWVQPSAAESSGKEPRSLAWKTRRKAYRFLERINWRTTARAALDPALRERLKQRHRSEVARLSELLGRDLEKLWGYDGNAAARNG